MFGVVSTILGARILSHYAASSSTPVHIAAVRVKKINYVSNVILQYWRTLSHGAGTPVDANKGVQGDGHTPHTFGVTTEQTDSSIAQVSSSMSPTVLAEGTPDLSLQQPMMPTAVVRDLRPPTRPYQLVPTLLQRPTGTPALYTPWTPTRVLQRRKHIRKRMGFLMQILEREQTERIRRARPLPDFRAGDILEVRMMLPEAERKVTIYRGVCIARYHKGIRSSFKIYNVYPECGGVVQHIPLYMPDLMGIKVVGRIPASQERLFYLLDRETSDYTFQTGVSAAN